MDTRIWRKPCATQSIQSAAGTWSGWTGPYDPEKFDIAMVNSDLEDPEKAWDRKIKS